MANLQTKLTELMAQKNISAIDIEKITGLNKNTIYSILAGNSKNPSAYNLQLIAKALDVSLESILLDDEISLEVLSSDQMKIFSKATEAIVKILIEKKISLSIDKLTRLITEVYQYSVKDKPHEVDERFIHWLIEKTHKL